MNKSNGSLVLSSGDTIYNNITIDSSEIKLTNNNGGATATLSGWGFSVSGMKNRVVSTDQYSDRLLYCYETPSPMFGDIGEGIISEDGKCYIYIDPVFLETITTSQYQVYLQKYGNGDCWVSERRETYFVVEGTPGLAFGWEIKAKQRDYDQRRLDRNDEPFSVPRQNYGNDAAYYIEDLRKGRVISDNNRFDRVVTDSGARDNANALMAYAGESLPE